MTLALERLESLRSDELEDGWLGTGSLAPTEAIYANAKALLGFMPDDVWAIPNDNGTISFEWGGDEIGGPEYNLLEVGLTRFAWIAPTAFLNGTIVPRKPGDDFDFDITTCESSGPDA